jgi:hypothetical protein
MAWFKLTAPNGDTVQVNADQLARVRIPAEGEAAKQANAIIDFASGQVQATLETPDQIMALIEGGAAEAEAKSAPTRRTRRGT